MAPTSKTSNGIQIANVLSVSSILYVINGGALPFSLNRLIPSVLKNSKPFLDAHWITTAFNVLLCLLLTIEANTALNSWAFNNWQWRTQREKWSWNKEIAVVTGGSAGIGLAIARKLAGKGIKVAVLDIQELPSALSKEANIKFFHCDVTRSETLASTAAAVRVHFGEPTILVNNAGIGANKPITTASPEWSTKIFQINIISHFWLLKEFLPNMVKTNKGHIISMASMSSFVTPPGAIHYAATKSALMALHEGLNQELKHVYKAPGVLNTIIHPSWVRTDLIKDGADYLEKTQGPLLDPSVIGDVVLDQVMACRGDRLIVPSGLAIASKIRAFPYWLQEIVRDKVVGTAAESTEYELP